MEDDNNQNNKFDLNGRDNNILPFNGQPPEKTCYEKAGETISHKALLRRKIKEISNGDWLLTQEILHEIEANHLSKDPDSKLTTAKARELLEEEIKNRYKDNEEVKMMLLDSLPTHMQMHNWRKMEGWQEAIWSKIRSVQMFNNENRYKVMDSMLKSAIKGDVQAAKIWLTLSGDYSDKMDVNTDKRIETYREINNIIHNNKIKNNV